MNKKNLALATVATQLALGVSAPLQAQVLEKVLVTAR